MHRTCLAVLVAALAACGGGGSGPAPAGLAGTWSATSLEVVNAGAPATRVELIALGAALTLELLDDQTFQETLRLPGEAEEVRTGTWSATGSSLALRYSPTNTMEFGLSLVGDTLTLTGADGEFDFDDDGSPEPAKVNVTATRT